MIFTGVLAYCILQILPDSTATAVSRFFAIMRTKEASREVSSFEIKSLSSNFEEKCVKVKCFLNANSC